MLSSSSITLELFIQHYSGIVNALFIRNITLELCATELYGVPDDFKIPGHTLEQRSAGRTLKAQTLP
jgi:hypothetical protein